MLSHVSSALTPPESLFFGWTCLKDLCDGGITSNAERGGDSGVANALQDGGERREGERTTWRKGLVRFRLIPIDGTYKGKMVCIEEMSFPPGDRGVPLGCVLLL